MNLTKLFFKNSTYKRLKFFAFMFMLIAPFVETHLYAEDPGRTAYEQQLDEDQRKFLEHIIKVNTDKIEEFKKGLITQEQLDKALTKQMNELKENKELADKVTSLVTQIENQKTILAKQGDEITKLKENGGKNENAKTLRDHLGDFLKSDDFKAFAEKNGRGKVKIEIKQVDITNDYTGGTWLITTRSDRVLDHPAVRKINMRDIIPVMPTDLPYLAFPEVYSKIDNVTMNTENGTLTEGSFKIREAQTEVKRLGNFMKISKRMLKAVTWLQNHLALRIPAMVRFVEDFQILFGDNVGNNLNGLTRNATAFNLSTAITYVATNIASIATWESGTKTKVTFAADHGLLGGETVTFSNAVNAVYNAAFKIVVFDARSIIIDAAYTIAGPETPLTWTGTGSHPFYHSIDDANRYDVLSVAIAMLNQYEYQATGIVMNQVDSCLLTTSKGTDGHYLGIQRGADGILRVDGVPVVETNAMPAGKFLVGDLLMACELLEFTKISIEITDDVTYKLNNEVAVIAEEEVLFPIYNKYMFIYGDFASAITELETP